MMLILTKCDAENDHFLTRRVKLSYTCIYLYIIPFNVHDIVAKWVLWSLRSFAIKKQNLNF